jgi:hypothetical protein
VEIGSRRISVLAAWRRSSAAAAVLCLGLRAVDVLGTVPMAIGVGAAACVAAVVQIVLRRFARSCALTGKLTDEPVVVRTRERMSSVRRRRAFARSLRATARPSTWDRRNPLVLWDRAALASEELLSLAQELERASTVDPRTMVELDRLLCDGRESPLFNREIPAEELLRAVRCIRFRVVTAAPRPTSNRPPVAAGKAAVGDCGRRRRRASARSRSAPRPGSHGRRR